MKSQKSSNACAAESALINYDTVRRRKDGSLIDISLTVSPLKDADGRIVGASKIARDITERKRAQEQQRLLVKEMKHRIKNSLATIRQLRPKP